MLSLDLHPSHPPVTHKIPDGKHMESLYTQRRKIRRDDARMVDGGWGRREV
jgi:hypothetical protein